MADNEEPSKAPDIDIDRNLDKRSRSDYLVFALIALCVVVALAQYFQLF